ncbi:hypothetical protein [Natronorubrum sp. DTA7]|uniref:hypothetical protein n=1 Tax=Natronorubrum sp. DTA7 TaxID=3447016 RepID=UPI003F8349D3
MNRDSYRFAIVIGFATVAGFLRGGQNAINPDLIERQLVMGFELSLDTVGLILSVVTLLSLVATTGIFVTGYRWADNANIPYAYGRFAVSLFIAAIAGYGLGYLPLSIIFTDLSILAISIALLTGSVSLLTIPITGLAGGAIAQYRSVTKDT